MNLDIAREVTAALAERESVSIEGWKWAKGVVLFPEARCPFCKDVMRSRALWVVHGYNLVGQAVPRAGRELKLDPPEHPHATPSAICMGNAVDPLQALFAGLNPKSSYFDTDDEHTGGMGSWLRGPYWQHACDELQEAEDRREENSHADEFCCNGCEGWYHDADSYSGTDAESYCESCYYNRFFGCYRCGESCDLNERKTYDDYDYCAGCFKLDHFTCEGCNSADELDNSYFAFDEYYCESCYDDKFFRCEECDGTCEIADLQPESNDGQGLLCKSCYDPRTCEECQEEHRKQDSFYCVTCIKNVCPDCTDEHAHDDEVIEDESTLLADLESLGQLRLDV